MKTPFRAASPILGLVACAALAYPAQAQQPPARPAAGDAASNAPEEAMKRFQRALALYDEGDFAASLIEFRKAYDLAPSFKLLYKIGQVSYKLKDYAGALRAFERYLAEGGDKISPDRRAEVQEEINVLRSQTGRIDVTANVFGALITIDDTHVGETPLEEPVLVSIGKRKVTVSAPGRSTVTRVVDVGGQETERVAVDLPALAAETRTIIAERPSKMTTWSWVGVGAAGAFGIGAAVTGVMARDAADELAGMSYVGIAPSKQVTDQQDKVKSRALATDVLAGAAVITLTTTLVWTFTRPDPALESDRKPSNGKARVQALVGPGALGLRGEF